MALRMLNTMTFNTTAERIAWVWDSNDVGCTIVKDGESGKFYLVTGSGAGAAKMDAIGGDSSRQRSERISLHSFRECDANGDFGAIAANGGILASDTTPILRGDAAETTEIFWAAGNADPIATQLSMPADFDGTRDSFVDLQGYSGTTNALAFTVETGWDGAALVSDTATGSASATRHVATATIAAADVPNAPFSLTIIITPGTHATDGFALTGARVRYFPT